jgi:hypothetical protein
MWRSGYCQLMFISRNGSAMIRTVEVSVVLELVAEERARDVDLLAADNRDLLARKDLDVENLINERRVYAGDIKRDTSSITSAAVEHERESVSTRTKEFEQHSKPRVGVVWVGPLPPPSGCAQHQAHSPLPHTLPRPSQHSNSRLGPARATHLLGENRGETTKEVALAVNDDGRRRKGRHSVRGEYHEDSSSR